MKAITFEQPFASLVSIHAKNIDIKLLSNPVPVQGDTGLWDWQATGEQGINP